MRNPFRLAYHYTHAIFHTGSILILSSFICRMLLFSCLKIDVGANNFIRLPVPSHQVIYIRFKLPVENHVIIFPRREENVWNTLMFRLTFVIFSKSDILLLTLNYVKINKRTYNVSLPCKENLITFGYFYLKICFIHYV